METYYVIYFWCLVTSIVFFFSKKTNFSKKIYLFLNILPISLIVGLRSEYNGRDTHMYTIIFKTIRDTDWNNLDVIPRIETFYLILNKLVSEFTRDTTHFFLVVSILTFTGISYYIYKNSNKVYLSLYLCICCLYIFEPMCTVRQMLANSLILFSYRYLLLYKYKTFIFTVIIASLFHSSALFMLCLLFFRLKNKDLKTLFIKIAFVFIFWAILIQIFMPLLKLIEAYAYYLQTDMIDTNNIRLGFVRDSIFSLIPLCMLTYGIKNKVYNEIEERNAYQLIVALFFFFLINLSTYLVSSIIMRLGIYFEFFIILAIPLSLKIFSAKVQTYLEIIIFLLFGIYFYLYLGMQYSSDLIQPYKMFIEG